MKARRHLIAWLGLVLPTLAIAALAFGLLAREQSRLDLLARESAQTQGRTAAESIDLLMAEIKTGVMQALQAASGPGDEEARLRELVASNPFVSHYLLLPAAPLPLRGDAVPQYPQADAKSLQPFIGRGAPPPWQQTPPRRHRNEVARGFAAQQEALAASAAPREPGRHYSRQGIRDLSQQNVQTLNRLKTEEIRQQAAFTALAVEGQPRLSEVTTPQAQERASPATAHTTEQPQTQGRAIALTANRTQQPQAQEGAAPAAAKRRSETHPQETAALAAEGFAFMRTDQPRPQAPTAAGRANETGRQESVALRQRLQAQRGQPPAPLPETDFAIPDFSDEEAEGRHGWLARKDGAPGWLGWYRRTPDSHATAVILDAKSVSEQLLGALPPSTLSLRPRIITAKGDIIAPQQTSRIGYTSESGQPQQFPIGSELPGWNIAIDSATVIGGHGFMLLGGLLVTILCAATLGAGTLLLLQARRDARDAVRKTTFVSNVSHELRTPLTTIRMYAEMLKEGRIDDEARRNRYLATITEESQRLSRLVDNVLDFSRLDQNRKQYRREAVDLAALVQAVLDSQTPRLRQAGMTIDWNPPQTPPVATTDRDALGQVLLNLTDNAIKYAASGKYLGVSLEADGTGIRLIVQDRGCGIALKDRERAFKAFQRLDESLTTAIPGSGLGLSICRSIAAGLGGSISLQNADGSGCRFIISLPADVA